MHTKRMNRRELLTFIILLLAVPSAWAGSKPMHLGVASCASSTCHGHIKASRNKPVALNEYFIWSKYDEHSRAYEVLKDARSRRIAKNMGLGEPSKAPQCLVCHSDYVPEKQRGPKFQLSDGVGCEACHGGAQNWIESHTEPDASYKKDVAQGMHPTVNPFFRARMCEACHVGDKNRLATHEMMAAGHPQLRFALDTWLANMPPHWTIDKDYKHRKGTTSDADLWAAGVITASNRYLQLLLQHVNGHNMAPQFALFDCRSCHRRMHTDVQRPGYQRQLIKAGALRPQDANLQMLGILVSLRDKSLGKRIQDDDRALHHATSGTVSVFRSRTQQLHAKLHQAKALFRDKPLSRQERLDLQKNLLLAAAHGHFRDYSDAVQLFLALQALTEQSDPLPEKRYDRLFALLKNGDTFKPSRISAEARRLLTRMQRHS